MLCSMGSPYLERNEFEQAGATVDDEESTDAKCLCFGTELRITRMEVGDWGLTERHTFG